MGDGLSPSLSVNYLPSKFSNSLITKRKKNGKEPDYMVPKQGGGREAFRSNESRMPGEADDDYDGVDVFGTKEGGRTRPRGRWNRFKWCLFVANFVVSCLFLVALEHRPDVCCFLLSSRHPLCSCFS